MTPITRWEAERGGWKEAVAQDERKLAATVRQMKSTLNLFQEEQRIKEAMDIHQFISPEVEDVKYSINDANLVEEIAASYSLQAEEIPDEDLDPVVLIRPAQALHFVQGLQEWEEQQEDGTYEVVRQLQALEKRIQRLQVEGLQQRTLDSYFAK
jgi:hypothetical protein